MKKNNDSHKLWYVIVSNDGLVSISNGKRSDALARLVLGETVMMTYKPLIKEVQWVFDGILETAEYDPELAMYELDEAAAQGFIRMMSINTGDAYRDAFMNQLKQSMEMAMAYAEN